MSVPSVAERGFTASYQVRVARGILHREVERGERRLSDLIQSHHRSIEGVRCYQLCKWLAYVGEKKSTHMLRGLPGHLPLEMLEKDERLIFLMRVRSEEQSILRRPLSGTARQQAYRDRQAAARG